MNAGGCILVHYCINRHEQEPQAQCFASRAGEAAAEGENAGKRPVLSRELRGGDIMPGTFFLHSVLSSTSEDCLDTRP